MFQFDYQWLSKNGRWQADMTREKDGICGSVMSLTFENSKYSSQVGFYIKEYREQFDGSLPKYVKTELIEFCREKMR